jgi:hypothetical protein
MPLTKHKSLNGDLDRLRTSIWIMLLKLLDDLELQRAGEAWLARKNIKPAIEPPYYRRLGTKSAGIANEATSVQLSFVTQRHSTSQ